MCPICLPLPINFISVKVVEYSLARESSPSLTSYKNGTDMSASVPDRVRYKTEGSHLVAELLDSHILTGKVASQISASLVTALDHQGSSVRTVRIDLTQVERIGSAGLNELIGFRTRARGQGLDVELAAAQPQIREVLALTRLDRVFDVPETSSPLG